MNTYQKEQWETYLMVRKHLAALSASEIESFRREIETYLRFRQTVDRFLESHFSAICTRKCYQNRLSACCQRDGIIIFFADIVINLLISSPKEIDALQSAVAHPQHNPKCIYLGEKGCLWRVKPIVCEMFLCDRAEEETLEQNAALKREWEKLNQRKKCFTWPDQPVLFDSLEAYFIRAGYKSPLMYMHESPGMQRVKGLAKRTNRVADVKL